MNELLLQRHSDILEMMSLWRSITTTNLKKIAAENDSYDAFRKRIAKLEKGGVLKSILNKGYNKIIYPSDDLLKSFGVYNFNVDNVRHDAAVTGVVYELSKYEIVKSIELPHQYKTKSTWRHKVIEPDAILRIEKNGQKNYVALEIELWRKGNSRVIEKFTDYAKASEYSYVFYIFPNMPSLNSYKLRLNEFLKNPEFTHLHSALEKKLVLIFNGDISKRLDDLNESFVYYDKKELKFNDLLGEKESSSYASTCDKFSTIKNETS